MHQNKSKLTNKGFPNSTHGPFDDIINDIIQTEIIFKSRVHMRQNVIPWSNPGKFVGSHTFCYYFCSCCVWWWTLLSPLVILPLSWAFKNTHNHTDCLINSEPIENYHNSEGKEENQFLILSSFTPKPASCLDWYNILLSGWFLYHTGTPGQNLKIHWTLVPFEMARFSQIGLAYVHKLVLLHVTYCCWQRCQFHAAGHHLTDGINKYFGVQ